MTGADPTRPISIEGSDSSAASSAETADPWLFGWRHRLFASPKAWTPSRMTELLSAAANKDAYRTLRDDGAASVSDLEPVAPPKKSFGKRGFAPLYQWEGVVEEVNGEGFRARLVPFENGQADPSRVEYADFEYDDLADESDPRACHPRSGLLLDGRQGPGLGGLDFQEVPRQVPTAPAYQPVSRAGGTARGRRSAVGPRSRLNRPRRPCPRGDRDLRLRARLRGGHLCPRRW